jgi:molybdate transport system regulatory protein
MRPTHVATARLTLRVDLGGDRAIGPGKIRLLEAIRDTGSITKAGAALGMSYRRAWLLVDDMNNCFREPVIAAQVGGSHGGGAALTPFGLKLIDQYRAIEAEAHSATAARRAKGLGQRGQRCAAARSPASITFPEEGGRAAARGTRRPATPASKLRSISRSGEGHPRPRRALGSGCRSARGGSGSRPGCSTQK